MSDYRNVSPFARIIGAIRLGAGAASQVASAARECRCLNCDAALPVAPTLQEQDRLCRDCRGDVVDGAVNVLGRIVKRLW